MDKDVETYLTGHCDSLTFGYCKKTSCIRFGKDHTLALQHVQPQQPWCIPLKIYLLLQEQECPVQALLEKEAHKLKAEGLQQSFLRK